MRSAAAFFFRAVGASFALQWRALARSRFSAALLALLAVVVVALPAQLRPDGTPAGARHMLLGWTLGAATALLGAATLWAGCASVPGEGRRFSSVRVSPARLSAVFAGRWLALVALSSSLLACSLFGLWVQARARLPREALETRAVIGPVPEALGEEAIRIRAWAAAPESDPAREESVLESIRRDLRSDALLPVPPGVVRIWRFGARRPRGSGETLRISFRCLSPYGSASGVAGTLSVLAVGGTAGTLDEALRGRPVASVRMDASQDGAAVLEIPAAAAEGGMAVVFANGERRDGSGASALVGWSTSLRVTSPGSGFAWNLLRAVPALVAVLSLLAAVGLAAGCAFSFPVAAFVATAAVAMVWLGASEAYDPNAAPDEVSHVHAAGRQPNALDRAVEKAAAGIGGTLRAVMAPVARANAAEKLADGLVVVVPDALWALAVDGVALPLMFSLVGAASLRRRELP